MAHKKTEPSLVQEFQDLYKKGYSINKIANTFNVSTYTVHKYVHKYVQNKKNQIKIWCPQSNIVYESVAQASARHNISCSGISKSLKTGKPVKGLNFIQVNTRLFPLTSDQCGVINDLCNSIKQITHL